jgi:hypothetical protein
VNANAYARECLHGRPDIHGVPAQPVELGDDQDIPGFELVQELAESRAFRGRHGARDGLSDHPGWLDRKAGGIDLA